MRTGLHKTRFFPPGFAADGVKATTEWWLIDKLTKAMGLWVPLLLNWGVRSFWLGFPVFCLFLD